MVSSWLFIAIIIMDGDGMTERVPRAVRPLYSEYKVMAEMLRIFNDDYYHLTIEQFTGVMMKLSGRHMNPERVRQIYFNLMDDAGLKPLYEKKK